MLSRVIYVDDSAPVGGDGGSWSSAYSDLQTALGAAVSGDEIRVGQGIYTPGAARTDTFQLKSGVGVYGGYAGYGADDGEARDFAQFASVLSGEIGDSGTNKDNSHHVATGSGTDSTAVLDGFTVTAGNADVNPNSGGGGMYNSGGSPTVSHCVFRGNRATDWGGGMYNSSASPTLTDCVFSDNSAGSGGGMYDAYCSPILSGCTFSRNAARSSGGGMYNSSSSPTVTNCTFRENSAGNSGGNDGGGICLWQSSLAVLNNCDFSGNSAASGGGIAVDSSASAVLAQCSFSRNSAGTGGGIRVNFGSATLVECVIRDNSARDSGGGIAGSSGSVEMANCSVTNNVAGESGGGMSSWGSSGSLTDCTFSANAAGVSGGGVENAATSSSVLSLIHCVFTLNAAQSGGGMYNSGGYNPGSPAVLRCVFAGNTAGKSGGAIYNNSMSPKVGNCTFSGNSARDCGGAIYNDSLSSPSPALSNCTLSGNWAGTAGGGVYYDNTLPKVINCILWGNEAPDGAQIRAVGPQSEFPQVSYCDVQGGFAGKGNIDAAPSFLRNGSAGPDGIRGTVDDDFGDLRLRPASAGIDAGMNTLFPDAKIDLTGNPRYADNPVVRDTGFGPAPIVDMGAYEAMLDVLATAGGPYALVDGDSVVLRGCGSSYEPGELTYEWDFDEDGVFDDAAGATPTFSASGREAPLTLDVALRVTDSSGAIAIDRTVINVIKPIYVDGAATGANNGASWADAYTSLQAALAAAMPGQTVYVAQGTYKPGALQTDTFQLKSSVYVYGGFAGRGGADPYARDVVAYRSVLSGDIGAIGSSFDNSYHVVTGSGAAPSGVLDGFTITGGNANWAPSYVSGGGMYCKGGSPTVRNCTFSDNAAKSLGGGMYAEVGSSPVLINCMFRNNTAQSGGGVYTSDSWAWLAGCTFSGNSAAGSGGGMYSVSSTFGAPSSCPKLADCTFSDNSAGMSGGGMYNGDAKPVLTNCTFTRNVAQSGGGMHSGITSTLIGCDLSENLARTSGGGVYAVGTSLVLADCDFSENSAGSYGGGIYNERCAEAAVDGCVFRGNAALAGGGMYNVSGPFQGAMALTECVFGGNSARGNGGGIYNSTIYSLMTLTRCTFSGNSATDNGGGMHNSGSSPTLDGCTFRGNSAQSGGGMHNGDSSRPILTDSTFTDNLAAKSGGGMCNFSSGALVANCTFAGNSGGVSGGGIYNDYSSPTLTGCIFRNNMVTASGGAMYNYSSSKPNVTSCRFLGNSASSCGGGVYNSSSSPALVNCAFVGNLAGNSGGAIANWSASSPTLDNCTLAGNWAGTSGGGIQNDSGSWHVDNCIVWGNAAPAGPQISIMSGSVSTINSDVEGGNRLNGGISADPQFIRSPSPGIDGKWGTADDDFGDLRLRPTSSAIDAGANWAAPTSMTTDLSGDPRFVDVPGVADTGAGTAPVVDMGAYEAVVPDIEVAGSGGDDEFWLSVMPGQGEVQIGLGDGAGETYALLALNSVRLSGGGGRDRVRIDFGNGSPVPVGGVSTDAEIIVLTEMRGTDALSVGAEGIRVGTGMIAAANLESVVLDGAGAEVTLGSLSLSGSARVSLPGNPGKVLRVAGVTIAESGVLDVGDGDVIVSRVDGDHGRGVVEQIRGWLRAGLVGGGEENPWTGSGLTSSAAREDEGWDKAIAVFNNDDGEGGGWIDSFEGVPVDAGCIILKYTYFGDANADGVITADDFAAAVAGWFDQISGIAPTWMSGDFDYDGKVTGDDFALVTGAWFSQDRARPLSAGASSKAGGRAAEAAPTPTPTPTFTPIDSAGEVAGATEAGFAFARREPNVVLVEDLAVLA